LELFFPDFRFKGIITTPLNPAKTSQKCPLRLPFEKDRLIAGLINCLCPGADCLVRQIVVVAWRATSGDPASPAWHKQMFSIRFFR
jgi:hypothetical protein